MGFIITPDLNSNPTAMSGLCEFDTPSSSVHLVGNGSNGDDEVFVGE